MARQLPVEPPAHIRGLPQDGRGYYVPAEAPWIGDEPKLAGLDPHRKTGLAFRRACTVCGYLLAPGERVWRAWSQRDAAMSRLYGGQLDVDSGPPGHLSCMLFSMFACPYWSSAAGRLSKSSSVAPGARRGTRPAVMGYRDTWVLIHEDPSRPLIGPGAPDMLFGYVELVEDIPFRAPADLLAAFAEAMAHDEQTIDVSRPRAYWRDTKRDLSDLGGTLDAGIRALHRSEPVQAVSYNGEPRTAFTVPLG